MNILWLKIFSFIFEIRLFWLLCPFARFPVPLVRIIIQNISVFEDLNKSTTFIRFHSMKRKTFSHQFATKKNYFQLHSLFASESWSLIIDKTFFVHLWLILRSWVVNYECLFSSDDFGIPIKCFRCFFYDLVPNFKNDWNFVANWRQMIRQSTGYDCLLSF